VMVLTFTVVFGLLYTFVMLETRVLMNAKILTLHFI
jgi:hypothetical protein